MRFYAVETPQRVDRGPLGRLAESARTAVKETLSGRPRFVVKLDRPAVRRAIRAARAATRFDAAQVELAGYASYVDELAGLPTVLVDHEAGTASGDDLATDPRALRFVRELFPRFSRVLALSEEDAADLAAASPGLQVGLRRPGVVPPDPSPYAAAEPGRLFFFGSAEHVPNHDAFAWLADEIWPAVRAAHPGRDLLRRDRPPARAAPSEARRRGHPPSRLRQRDPRRDPPRRRRRRAAPQRPRRAH
jgi:hypothetical protein